MSPVSTPPQTTWEEGDQLVGEGDQVIKIGLADVVAYRVAFYVDAGAAGEALRSFIGSSYEEVCNDPGFFTSLVEGRFRKTLRIAFMRRMPKAQIQAAFHGTLSLRADLSCASDIEAFTSTLADVSEEDVLTVRLDADGQRLEIDATWREPPSKVLYSQRLWRGLQRAYFDERTDVPMARVGMIRHMPERVLAAELSPMVNATGAIASSDAGVRRAVAGRSHGKDRRKAGDSNSGTWSWLRSRRGRNHEDSAANATVAKMGNDQVYLQEIAQLRSEAERLQKLCCQNDVRQRVCFQTGCFSGAAMAMLIMLLVNALLAPKVEQPVGLALFTVMVGSAFVSSRAKLSERSG